ncbi:uncharacterized protein LOC109862864 [Pseudomyrmex gracilis]|uniref:uncharacterized protein LOC109862864 n=1 Tax=Pseudomyrmex gracilis TaxID=219809 RepID=UPI0009959851|nr:uncharacterized protein LOC109862864 [Pseudomyrmex gracilis]
MVGRDMRREMEDFRKVAERMGKEIEEWKKEGQRWKKEKENLIRKVKILESRMAEKGVVAKESKKKEKREGEGSLEGRVVVIEREIEMRERVERKRRNLIIKGVKKEKGDIRWEVEKVFKEIRAVVKVEEIRRLNGGSEDKGEMVWVRVEKRGQKENLGKEKEFKRWKSMD